MERKQRIVHVDILKGILIILVVLGHIPGASQNLHQWIYWFHMPAFFMVSGFFIKENFYLKDEVVGKFRRLLVPYLFFSLVLGTVARDGNVFKQTAGTLIGANGNITTYTFPFYFLTVLFFALVFIYAMKAKLKTTKAMAIGVVVLYALSHLLRSFMPDRLLGWIPWNIDMAIFAVAFLFIGNILIIKQLQGGVVGLLIAALLTVLWVYGIWNYSFDLKQHNWHWILDIVIPFIFTMALLTVSKWLECVWGVRQILTLAGEGSMCILLLHPLFIDINFKLFGDVASVLLLTILNVTECLILFEILIRFDCTRFIIGMPAKKKLAVKTAKSEDATHNFAE